MICHPVPGSPVWSQEAWSPSQVRAGVEACLETLVEHLPATSGRIFLKPALGNDRPGLSGATTDMRVLVAMVEALQDRGYRRIMIGDSPMPAYLRSGVDPAHRLGVHALVRRYGLSWVDLLLGPHARVELPSGPVRVLSSALEAELLIHLPTISTHPDAGLTMATWHLKGLIHPLDRPALTRSLSSSLVALAQRLRPGITLLDALIVMEGDGPLDGTPLRLERLFWGNSPLAVDLLAARKLGYTPEEVPYLWTALYEHALGPEAQVWVERHQAVLRDLRRPKGRGAARKTGEMIEGWLHGHVRRRAEQSGWARVADALRLRPQVDARDDHLHDLSREAARCGECRRCEAFCPTGLIREEIGASPAHPRCIECLYCLQVCDRGALRIEGEPGALMAWVETHKTTLEQL